VSNTSGFRVPSALVSNTSGFRVPSALVSNTSGFRVPSPLANITYIPTVSYRLHYHLLAMFKGFCELAVKMRWMKNDKFQHFRMDGSLFSRVSCSAWFLLGTPQMTIRCLWEFTQIDSPAKVVVATSFFFGMKGNFVWAALKVIRIAKRSVEMHKHPDTSFTPIHHASTSGVPRTFRSELPLTTSSSQLLPTLTSRE
jgi:hypothetical protein